MKYVNPYIFGDHKCLQTWNVKVLFEYCIFLYETFKWKVISLTKVKGFETLRLFFFFQKKKNQRKVKKKKCFHMIFTQVTFLAFNWKHLGMGLADCNKIEVTNSHPAILRVFCFYSFQIKTKRTFLWTLVPNQRPLWDFTFKDTL